MNKDKFTNFKTSLFTACALLAFAANSVLCRLALGDGSIDAFGFTLIRLLSGTVTLAIVIIAGFGRTPSQRPSPLKSNVNWLGPNWFGPNWFGPNWFGPNWFASFMLFTYAIAFSFAYLTLTTGTGALILFGSVQITMILIALIKGTKLSIIEWLGLAVAFGGFIYLNMDGAEGPSTKGFLLMAAAGMAWGIYTVMGKLSENPLRDTAYNFIGTIPFLIIAALIFYKDFHATSDAIVYAILSGALASALGYALWYKSLKGLTITTASVLQLAVPVIAAYGGVLFVEEKISLKLAVSSAIILGGILMVIAGKHSQEKKIRRV